MVLKLKGQSTEVLKVKSKLTVICDDKGVSLEGTGSANDIMNIIDVCLDSLAEQGIEEIALLTIMKRRTEKKEGKNNG